MDKLFKWLGIAIGIVVVAFVALVSILWIPGPPATQVLVDVHKYLEDGPYKNRADTNDLYELISCEKYDDTIDRENQCLVKIEYDLKFKQSLGEIEDGCQGKCDGDVNCVARIKNLVAIAQKEYGSFKKGQVVTYTGWFEYNQKDDGVWSLVGETELATSDAK